MSKSELTRAKQERKKVNLADRYQKIGIGAVAAALRCQKQKNPDHLSAWRRRKENSS
jgi:hypothetical protein